jgi:hypothetical protein
MNHNSKMFFSRESAHVMAPENANALANTLLALALAGCVRDVLVAAIAVQIATLAERVILDHCAATLGRLIHCSLCARHPE